MLYKGWIIKGYSWTSYRYLDNQNRVLRNFENDDSRNTFSNPKE